MQSPSPVFSIHILTASGAFLALLAATAAARGAWVEMFAWLGAALIVDGVDGPLARRFEIKARLPRWNGVILDLVVDYLTYVFIPAMALTGSGLLGPVAGALCGAAITIGGAIYFADNGMKTPDDSFMGFPGCWNMIVFTLFAAHPPEWVTIAVVAAATAATFAPLKFVHPVRSRRWRPLTLAMMALWLAAASWCALQGFEPGPAGLALLLASGAYLFLAGAAQQALERIRG